MFPTVGGKRRGCGFENPEPSSPKVTCIGQVRVKTKKQGKKMRSRSGRRGEASFRKTEQSFHQVGAVNSDLTRQNSQSSFQYNNQNHQNLQQECLKHRNQRWVHLPLTICEALREFSCFFPCRSSCISKDQEKGCEISGEHGHHVREEGSCGAAFARWLVALQEGDGKGREIELVMGEEDAGNGRGNDNNNYNDDNVERSYSQRRHVLEDIDIEAVERKKNEKYDEEFGEEEEEEEKGRVSICIPPKNALLLMRCRSDPVKMAALASRFWESPVHKDQDEGEIEDKVNEEEEESGEEEEGIEMEEDEGESKSIICEKEVEASFVNSIQENVITLEATPGETEQEVKGSYEIESIDVHEPNQDKEIEEEEKDECEEGSVIHKGETFSCLEVHADLEKPEIEEEVKEEQQNDESSELYPTPSTLIASELQNDETKAESEVEEEISAEAESTATMAEISKEEKVVTEIPPPEQQQEETDPTHEGSDPVSGGSKVEEREALPECLLLMMCEPKLSMEVSKETWVCSTDFVRWLPPERLAGKTDAATFEKRVSVGSKPKKPSPQPFLQPPRSSCSFPAAAPVPAGCLAGMIEQKLVGSKSSNGYEPFVLTRCKSEPMRSSAKLAQEACFWKNRKLERAIGAPAGVGF